MEIVDIVVPFTVKEAMYSLDICRPTLTELKQCIIYEIKSDIPWNPEEIQYKLMDPIANDQLCGELELEDTRPRQHTLKRTSPQTVQTATKYAPYFLYPGKDIMEATLRHTTRFGKLTGAVPMKKHQKSYNPLLNRRRLPETFATDTIFSKSTSFEGYNAAQGFAGARSSYCCGFGMATESDGPSALLDFFRQVGVPVSLIRDNSKMQSSKLWNDYCRRYQVADKPIEPYHPQQNAFEREMAKWKTDTLKLILMSNCDPRAWF